MLQALIHRKLERWLVGRAPEAIEDLLTSVVLGSASYEPVLGLLPFLCDAVSLTGEPLAPRLGGLRVGEVWFWPRLPDGSEPDVLVELLDSAGHKQLLIIEVKLGAGKSSHASDTGPVTDQLGKYWLSLGAKAVTQAQPCSALAVVYLTTDVGMPRRDLEATQHELRRKTEQEAPLYWLSWRRFSVVVRTDESQMLRDCIELLHERWNLIPIVMKPLRPPLPLPAPWHYHNGWRWSAPPRVRPAWRFSPGDPV